jgi:uncharacterized membrane protein
MIKDSIETMIGSFRELFLLIRKFYQQNKTYLKRSLGFFIFFTIIILVSLVLKNISFLESIETVDYNNVAELQPDVFESMRVSGLLVLTAAFSFIIIAVGKWQGFGSLVGLILSGFTIIFFIVPLILNGWNPALVTLIAGTIVITGTIYFAHGFNLKTTIAIIGGTSSLLITLLIGEIFRSWIQVSGYYGEYSYYLLAKTQINFDMGSIVLSMIIMSGIGLLDDVTITQTSVIEEIFKSTPGLTIKEIYAKAMNVGRDHVGALVNSLFWAYAAVAMPAILVIYYSQVELSDIVIRNHVIIEEVLRTMVSSMGLVLSVPITTFLGAYAIKRYDYLADKFTNFLARIISKNRAEKLNSYLKKKFKFATTTSQRS